MGIAALDGLDQLVDDVPGRRTVGIAHAEIDDVFAAAARRHLEFDVILKTYGGSRWMRSNSVGNGEDIEYLGP